MLKFKVIKSENEFDENYNRENYVDFLFDHLDKFGDEKEAINKCIDFAFEKNGGLGGFLLLAYDENDKVVGELIINYTGMSGYIPENILVYVAVDRDQRGKGYGGEICKKAIDMCDGDVKLHVEYDNPAKRLYERIGFTTKYAEMRYNK
jgi:GNAT superfamily N-acetyltransferase